ncbi:hypothetical protein K470DRAFT_268902 [Piedraia hortae CBS 480.64]|uniref:Uncharacterized protein n=1 Tax=Piedraia hortae CBS 480.64 TaxID=1314780 RepID=A0A6A7C4Y8_9PEZI|nr:hypothetical protein K470DRAFT_268902 [Piedraia hortae CBS 480.64]
MPTRLNPCSHLPRRLQIVASLVTFVLVGVFVIGSGNDDRGQYLQQFQAGAAHVVDRLPLPRELPRTPLWLNPFRGPAHRPPEQANSSAGEARWYSDFKWRNPFSSSVTLDEDRAVLPPLRTRPPVYTYFDPPARSAEDKKADQALLQTWRRAWWAQGFRPIVLSKSDAMNNPLYPSAQALHLEPEMEQEMMRWLAWAHMGTGVLCDRFALPMAPYDDALLSFLRRGQYPELSHYDGLENALFVGSKDDILKALKEAIASPAIQRVKSIPEAVSPGTILNDPNHDGVAYYSNNTLSEKYTRVWDQLTNTTTSPTGLTLLRDLINSHLHNTWLETFTSGIAVLKPLGDTTALIQPALNLARNLTSCSPTPIPASCPPNRPKCIPCVSKHRLPTLTRPLYRNSSTLFTIGTVPHPHTLLTLTHTHPLNVFYVRRHTKRDVWIQSITKEFLGTGISSFARLTPLKEAIASPNGEAHSIWFTAEQPYSPNEVDWVLGFQVPRQELENGKSETPVPGPERRPKKSDEQEGREASPEQLAKEEAKLASSVEFLTKRPKGGKKGAADAAQRKRIKEMIEAWNLADTEAWKFVRAWDARRKLERGKWEEEEEGFVNRESVLEKLVDKLS